MKKSPKIPCVKSGRRWVRSRSVERVAPASSKQQAAGSRQQAVGSSSRLRIGARWCWLRTMRWTARTENWSLDARRSMHFQRPFSATCEHQLSLYVSRGFRNFFFTFPAALHSNSYRLSFGQTRNFEVPVLNDSFYFRSVCLWTFRNYYNHHVDALVSYSVIGCHHNFCFTKVSVLVRFGKCSKIL